MRNVILGEYDDKNKCTTKRIIKQLFKKLSWNTHFWTS